MSTPRKPTEAELEILQLLWKEGPSTVRFINETLAERRQIGYTTTLKTMQIMFEKGMLTREQEGRGHRYAAAYEEQATQKALVNRLMDGAFGGSALKLVMQALGNRGTSKQELAEIRAYIDDLETDAK